MPKRTTYSRRVTPVSVALLAMLALLCGLAVYGAFCSGPSSRRSATDPSTYEAATVLWVSDGDTLFVRRASGEEVYVRLIGIDAPESVNPDESRNTPEGEAAAAFVKDLVAPGIRVWLARDVSDTDKYGRLLRYVWLEKPADPLSVDEVREKMLDAVIVAAGHADVKRYPPDTTYHTILVRIAREAA